MQCYSQIGLSYYYELSWHFQMPRAADLIQVWFLLRAREQTKCLTTIFFRSSMSVTLYILWLLPKLRDSVKLYTSYNYSSTVHTQKRFTVISINTQVNKNLTQNRTNVNVYYLYSGTATRNFGYVTHNVLGSNCFSSTRFTTVTKTLNISTTNL